MHYIFLSTKENSTEGTKNKSIWDLVPNMTQLVCISLSLKFTGKMTAISEEYLVIRCSQLLNHSFEWDLDTSALIRINFHTAQL